MQCYGKLQIVEFFELISRNALLFELANVSVAVRLSKENFKEIKLFYVLVRKEHSGAMSSISLWSVDSANRSSVGKKSSLEASF